MAPSWPRTATTPARRSRGRRRSLQSGAVLSAGGSVEDDPRVRGDRLHERLVLGDHGPVEPLLALADLHLDGEDALLVGLHLRVGLPLAALLAVLALDDDPLALVLRGDLAPEDALVLVDLELAELAHDPQLLLARGGGHDDRRPAHAARATEEAHPVDGVAHDLQPGQGDGAVGGAGLDRLEALLTREPPLDDVLATRGLRLPLVVALVQRLDARAERALLAVDLGRLLVGLQRRADHDLGDLGLDLHRLLGRGAARGDDRHAEQADGHEAGKNSVIAHRASPVVCLWNWSSQPTSRAPTRRDPPPPAPTAAYDPAVPETRRGLLFGVAAYAMWGFFPLYWRLLEETGALELLAARVTFSLLVMVVLVLALRRLETFGAMVRDRRLRWLLTMAAVL